MTRRQTVPDEVVELPQDQLIAWISKQLSLGIRSSQQNDGVEKSGMNSVITSIEAAFSLKKDIVKSSKQISSYLNNILVEEWKVVETEFALIDQQRKLAEQKAIMESVKRGCCKAQREIIGTHSVIMAEVDISDTSYVRTYIDLLDEFRKRIESQWLGIESQYEEDLLARKAEDELLETDAKGNQKFITSISVKRQTALDVCLNERFILKKQKERRLEFETELKRELAALSAQLHAKRELDRVKETVESEQDSKRDAEKEAKEREMEWKLMDEEIALTRKLKQLEDKFGVRNEKISNEIQQTENMILGERQFVSTQMKGVEYFRKEISRLRLEVKEIEQTVSRFKSYLRHAKKEDRKVRE
jgi:hypothetical protein